MDKMQSSKSETYIQAIVLGCLNIGKVKKKLTNRNGKLSKKVKENENGSINFFRKPLRKGLMCIFYINLGIISLH